MKHVRCVTIPRMAIEQKSVSYKQDTIFGPIIAVGKLVALVGGTFLEISSLLSGFRTEL